MYSFKQFLQKDDFIINLADQYFNQTLDEASDTAIVYYEKDPQVIMISQHGLEDGKRRGRLWWNDENHLQDPKFTDFADKCLDRMLDNFENKNVGVEIGFSDQKEKKGWVVRLNKSKDGEVTSFTIITVLYMPVMNQNAPLFVKKDSTYIINVDKPKPISKTDKDALEYKSIDSEIKKLTDEYEIAYIESDDMPEGKEKNIKMKEVKKLQDRVQNLKNRRDKLKSQLSISESVCITDKITNKSVRFIMV